MIENLLHGSERERREKIINDNVFPITRGDKHWLGDGIYFFDHIIHAYKWIIDMHSHRYPSNSQIPDFEGRGTQP